MTTLLAPTPPLEKRSTSALVPPSGPQMIEPASSSVELLRWVRWLGVPFVLGAAFFAAAIGTGQLWLMGLAWGLGPELMILVYIYLSLSSEANSELAVGGGQ